MSKYTITWKMENYWTEQGIYIIITKLRGNDKNKGSTGEDRCLRQIRGIL